MGLLWALDRGCSEASQAVALKIRDALWREEFLDVWMDDTYVQRALLLAFAPSSSTRVKPIWVTRIVGHQLPDGGWDSDADVLRIDPDRYVMLGTNGVTMRGPVSSFHTTAQAILLLARLLHDPPKDDSSRLARWAPLSDG